MISGLAERTGLHSCLAFSIRASSTEKNDRINQELHDGGGNNSADHWGRDPFHDIGPASVTGHHKIGNNPRRIAETVISWVGCNRQRLL